MLNIAETAQCQIQTATGAQRLSQEKGGDRRIVKERSGVNIRFLLSRALSNNPPSSHLKIGGDWAIPVDAPSGVMISAGSGGNLGACNRGEIAETHSYKTTMQRPSKAAITQTARNRSPV